jgi:hypothetical protein
MKYMIFAWAAVTFLSVQGHAKTPMLPSLTCSASTMNTDTAISESRIEEFSLTLQNKVGAGSAQSLGSLDGVEVSAILYKIDRKNHRLQLVENSSHKQLTEVSVHGGSAGLTYRIPGGTNLLLVHCHK